MNREFCKSDDYHNPFRYGAKLIESSIEKIIFIIQDDSPLMSEILGQKEALDEFFEVELRS